jgi:CheY-like chemotaxis protein
MKKRVLVVDEDRNELDSFLEILRHIQGPVKCTHADSGRQAIEVLQHTAPDFIFIDYELSEINALQVVSAIRFQSKLKDTKVYLYSETITDDSSKMARMLGATGCIEMSGDLNDLVHKFKAIFSPELLPSYVFLKNYQKQFLCFNAAFLKDGVDDDVNCANPVNNLNLAPNSKTFQNQLRGELM